jgi:hypothetical protein
MQHPNGSTYMTQELGVTQMTKLISRNKYMFSLFVLALLALSSGAGIKWY